MTIKTIYDPRNDTLFVRLAEGDIIESEEVSPDIILDYDANGMIVALQVLSASKKVAQNPAFLQLQVA